jgi:DNA end-binding protein Ku
MGYTYSTMARAIWSGAISFGLVNVPVKMYSAVRKKSVRFHQLHDKTGGRIQQKRVDGQSGKEVPYEHIVKGYEIGPDRYVVINPDELDALAPKKTRTIDIEDFVELAEIDPIYFDHPYYLAPGPAAQKPYALLRDAMAEAGKVAIAKVVIRQKENLVAIRATDEILTMATLLFADEVVPPDNLDDAPDEDIKTTKKELQMAQSLIESLTAEWEPEKYKDEYRDQVLDLIERKAEGKEIAVAPEAEEPAEVPDLMAALEASLQAAKQSSGNGGEKARKKPAARKPAAKKAAAKKPTAKKAATKKPAAKKTPAKRSTAKSK